MKCSLLTFLLLVSQVVLLSAQTTEEEYNYITQGYKIQQERGLDMKAGYEMLFQAGHDVDDPWKGRQTIHIYGLFRENETEYPCAIMIEYVPEHSTTKYYCIPHPKSDNSLWERFYEDIVTADVKRALAYGIARGLGHFAFE